MIDKLANEPYWQPTSIDELPIIKQGELHIWHVNLQLNAQQTSQALSWISDSQHQKYNKLQDPNKKKAYLAGRYYLLTLLGAYTRTHPQAIQLAYTRLNKPYLSNQQRELHFNLSDTTAAGKSTALFAFSSEGELGIDIEDLSRQGNFKAIVKSRFSPAEKKLVTLENGDINTQLFLYLWTRKEASGKATGQGINFKMNQRCLLSQHNEVDTANDNDQLRLSEHLYTDEANKAWRLNQLRVNNELIACVAYSGHKRLNIKTFAL